MGYWVTVCAKCGKKYGHCNTIGDKRPFSPPSSMIGTCTSSRDKKHKPKWERRG